MRIILQTSVTSFDLRTVLDQNEKIHEVLEYYESNKRLNNAQRNILIDAIIDNAVLNNLKLSRQVMSSIASQICDVFETEEKVTRNLENSFPKSFHFSFAGVLLCERGQENTNGATVQSL